MAANLAPQDADLSFTLTFWADVASVVICAVLIAALRSRRQAAQGPSDKVSGGGGNGSASARVAEAAVVLAVLPIYEPVLWFLGGTFALQAALLGAPGPYPNTPAWYFGNVEVGGGAAESVGSSAIYFTYWFAYELMTEGFGILLLHAYPCPEAFASALGWGSLYALLASGLTTVGYNWRNLGLDVRSQIAFDSVFIAMPILLYGALLIGACYAAWRARRRGNTGDIGEDRVGLASLISTRRSFLPYVIFSLLWRSLALLFLDFSVYTSGNGGSAVTTGSIITLTRSIVAPVVIYATLVYDSQYWQSLARDALAAVDAADAADAGGDDALMLTAPDGTVVRARRGGTAAGGGGGGHRSLFASLGDGGTGSGDDGVSSSYQGGMRRTRRKSFVAAAAVAAAVDGNTADEASMMLPPGLDVDGGGRPRRMSFASQTPSGGFSAATAYLSRGHTLSSGAGADAGGGGDGGGDGEAGPRFLTPKSASVASLWGTFLANLGIARALGIGSRSCRRTMRRIFCCATVGDDAAAAAIASGDAPVASAANKKVDAAARKADKAMLWAYKDKDDAGAAAAAAAAAPPPPARLPSLLAMHAYLGGFAASSAQEHAQTSTAATSYQGAGLTSAVSSQSLVRAVSAASGERGALLAAPAPTPTKTSQDAYTVVLLTGVDDNEDGTAISPAAAVTSGTGSASNTAPVTRSRAAAYAANPRAGMQASGAFDGTAGGGDDSDEDDAPDDDDSAVRVRGSGNTLLLCLFTCGGVCGGARSKTPGSERGAAASGADAVGAAEIASAPAGGSGSGSGGGGDESGSDLTDDDDDEDDDDGEGGDGGPSDIDKLLLPDIGVDMKRSALPAPTTATRSRLAAGGKRRRRKAAPPAGGAGFTLAATFYNSAGDGIAGASAGAAPVAGGSGTSASGGSREVARVEKLRQQVASSLLIDSFALEVGPFLDSGATSAVHAGKYRRRPVAIKMFRPEKLTAHAIAFLNAEHKLSAALRHPNVVRYYGLCVVPPHISLVFDYCARGSLYNLLDRLLYERDMYAEYYGVVALDAWSTLGDMRAPYCAPGCTLGEWPAPAAGADGGAGEDALPHRHARLYVRLANGDLVVPPPPPMLSWRRRLRMARDGAAALAYLHSLSPPIAHRDVKSQNLLVTRGFRLKLSDFGESRQLPPGHIAAAAAAAAAAATGLAAGADAGAAAAVANSAGAAGGAGSAPAAPELEPMTGEIGTLQWMAPEMMRCDKHYFGPAVDVYSYGTVMWELLTCQHPFEGVAPDTIYMLTLRGQRPAIPDDCPPAYAKLLRACWEASPAKRPTAAAVLAKLQRMLDQLDKKAAAAPQRQA